MSLIYHTIAYASDNFAYLISNIEINKAILVDCGDADVILHYIEQEKVNLDSIFLTHLHNDHIGGLEKIRSYYPQVKVYSGGLQGTIQVQEGEKIDCINSLVTVYNIESHSAYDRAFVIEEALFSGDVLFSAGCGRLFDGNADDLQRAFQKLTKLPKETKVYFAHEYTETNIAFAKTVDPLNQNLQEYAKKIERIRKQGNYSTPSSLAIELQVNPFLRTDKEGIISVIDVEKKLTKTQRLAKLREMKNVFTPLQK